ncbi:hypothetical protein QBC39DRAFT_116021 [Podospora conica]|nr:hypothetical protein QBC39DRAFT_116021 [Schizothecium conicum]
MSQQPPLVSPTTLSGTPLASSSSEGSPETVKVYNVQNRCVAPPRLLPLNTVELRSQDTIELINPLIRIAPSFIEEANLGIPLSCMTIKGVGRAEEGSIEYDIPTFTQPTILIVVDRSVPWSDELMKSAEAFVRRFKSFVDTYVRNEHREMDIAVEFISDKLVAPKHVSFVEWDQDLAQAWSGIEDAVQDILEKHSATREKMNSLSLIRLGYDSNRDLNPKTVYITLDYDSPEPDWPPVWQELQSYVDTFNMDLVVHMEHNSCDRY